MMYYKSYKKIRKASFEISMMYPLAASMMPKDLYVKVFVLYQMLRVADIIEDNSIENKDELLNIHTDSLHKSMISGPIEKIINEISSNKQEKAISRHYRMFFETFQKLPESTKQIIASTTHAMIPGMINDEYKNIKTWNDLNIYSGYVAGEVGKGLTKIFSEHLPFNDTESMIDTGYRLGIGLQKINILKDLREDIENGRNYVPEELADKYSVNKNYLFPDSSKFLNNILITKARHMIVKELAIDAQDYLSKGLSYVTDIPILKKQDPDYGYSRGIRSFNTTLLMVAQEMSFNMYNNPGLTDKSYRPKSLLLKYGLIRRSLWKDNERIKYSFKQKKLII